MTNSEKGILYIIPASLGTEGNHVIPEYIKEIANSLNAFIVEHPKTARRFLRAIGFTKNFDSITMNELNEHTKEETLSELLQPIYEGKNTGLLSEAGCPGIADPGADLIALAHQQNIKVQPLVGPSSILLALISSGLNGQNFAFNGYLPIDNKERIDAIKKLETKAVLEKQTQIFIETPYRNKQLLDVLVKICKNDTILSIATDITLSTEKIQSKPIGLWKNKLPDIHKRPTVFLIGK